MYLLCIAYCGFMKNLFIQGQSMQICLYITWLYIHIYIKPAYADTFISNPAYTYTFISNRRMKDPCMSDLTAWDMVMFMGLYQI